MTLALPLTAVRHAFDSRLLADRDRLQSASMNVNAHTARGRAAIGYSIVKIVREPLTITPLRTSKQTLESAGMPADTHIASARTTHLRVGCRMSV